MSNSDHQKIIERVLELVCQQLKESGMLQFTALTIDEQGNERRIDVDPEFFRSEANKDRLKDKMRRDFRRRGIVRYALVAECWMGQQKPMPSAPVCTENLTHYLDR
jgi:hypothetical protein